MPRVVAGQRTARGRRQQHLCRFHPKLVLVNMSHTTLNTIYTSNRGGRRTIDRNSVSFVHVHRIIATTPGMGYPSNEGIQDMAMRDASSFRFTRRGQELSANDTIWASAIVTDRSLMCRQEHPDVRRDKLLEKLIDIGVYDRGEWLDLNDDLAEKRSFHYAAILTNMLWDTLGTYQPFYEQ
jgi:hypothetical protein